MYISEWFTHTGICEWLTHACICDMYMCTHIHVSEWTRTHVSGWCERCILITESPKTPGHYRYLIWVLGYIPYMRLGLAVFSVCGWYTHTSLKDLHTNIFEWLIPTCETHEHVSEWFTHTFFWTIHTHMYIWYVYVYVHIYMSLNENVYMSLSESNTCVSE